uniref:Agenet domain-containing protein n=1 Tax=Oryza punctata TaxID=4537 RepID=A0A0E0MEV5_ORYPU
MGRAPSKKLARRPRTAARMDEEEGDGKQEEALLFPVGAEVEVGSDDPGFVGSFYEGTVEAHLPGGDGYVVAYSTLEEGGAALREEVRARDVRPQPPPLPVAGAPGAEGFAMHDMVEAFHNEGWWSGVVTGLPLPLDVVPVDPRRRVYTVAFPTSREVMEFEEAALRPHRVFRHGSWVPAADVDNGGSAFREGSLVEVSRSAESFGQSWNPATILKVIGSTNFLVQYRHVGDDGELVTEIVDTEYIRPARSIIRMDSKYRFSPSSHVEVFHEGSWWPGIILDISSSVFGKMYVVKLRSYTTGMDNVDGVDKLTVENTKLRPRFEWDGRKWMRCMTKKKDTKAKKLVIRGSQLTSRKKPIPADLASCNDSDEIRDKSSSDKMMKTADVVPRPKETMKQQNAVLALASQRTLPLQSSMTGSGHLKYDSSLILGSPIELSSSLMDVMPSVPQTAGLQASLFGVFGQLRSIPQDPLLVMQSPHPDLSRNERSKASTDQEKQSTDEDCCLISSAANSFNFGSFSGIYVSRKRKECVSFQAPEELGVNPETSSSFHIQETKKNRVDETIEGTQNIAEISEEQTKLIIRDEHDELPTNIIAGSAIPSEKNTVSRIDPTPLEDNKGPRESSIVDKISPSGTDDIRQDENLILPATSTLDISGDVNLLSSDPSPENQKKISKSEGCEISMDEDSGEEFCRSILVMPDDARMDQFTSAKSVEATRHDDLVCKENLGAIVECVMNTPTENLSFCSPAMFDDGVPNQSSVSENCQDNKQDGMDEVDHGANVVELASIIPETQHASVGGPLSTTSLAALEGEIVLSHSKTWESAFYEQSGVSQQHHSSAMVESPECVAESSQSIDDSTITQLCSFDTSQCIDAELGNSLIISNNIQDTPISKYVARTQNSSCPLMQKFLHVHENIMVDQPSESLAIVELPFVKTSPMWAQIEAMEVFSKVPQRPNFHQLQQHPPEFREGMALGLMYSFTNLAESINMLNVHDDNAVFEHKMKCISVLEADGFDVRHLRSRLETLVSLKNNWSKMQDMMKRSKKKIAQEEIDDQQRRAEISVLSMVVRQLEQHAHLFRCIKNCAISQQMSHAVEKSRLQVEASQLKQSSLSAEQHFSSVVTAPW